MSKTKAFGIAELSEDERKDVVATLFRTDFTDFRSIGTRYGCKQTCAACLLY